MQADTGTNSPHAPETGRQSATGDLPDPIVSLKGISKTFENGTSALQNVSLDIQEGAFVSLLGPSGCGKSTVLRLLTGLDTPSSGGVVWPCGPSGQPDQELSFVFQEPTLMPWATVFSNVYLPLRLKGISRKDARAPVMDAIDMVGLSEAADSYPRELSGGMKMRVSIARALVTKPTILLMDEPFAALDEITRFKLNNDLMDLWHSCGLTIIFVTHSVFESVYLSNRIVVMAGRPGRVVKELEIDAPSPRDEAFRTSSTYAGYCRVVSNALHAAMGETVAQ